MRVDARNKSGEDFFQVTFRYPTHWKCIVILKCEPSTEFKYVWEYIVFSWIYMNVKNIINARIESKKKLNYIWCIGDTPPTHFLYIFLFVIWIN